MTTDGNDVIQDLREAERFLTRALRAAGMRRGRRGYVAPTIASALEDVRDAIRNLDAPALRRRSWTRLARTR